jgi:hypothetical protein
LANAAAHNTPLPADVFLQVISNASVKTIELEPRVINLIQGKDWHAMIMVYLHHYYEPDSIVEHTRMQYRPMSYRIDDNDLYRTSILGPLLWCVSKTEGQEILSDIHAGTCGGHIGAKALHAKVLWQGFYWLAVIDDAAKIISTCEACKKFSCKIKAPAQPVQLVAPSWPLERWGINIIGKLTPAQGNYTFSVVVVEYFTKWVEAKPLTNVSSASIRKFFRKNIICHYGVPRHITVDNAKYFGNAMFKDFCQLIGVKVAFVSVYHPQTNEAGERANGLIFEAIKKILKGEKKEK